MKALISLLVVLVLVLAAKGWLDGQADLTVETASQMYNEKQYDEALKELDKLEWYPWKPPASEESEKLRQKIEKKIAERERREADERRWEAERQQYEAERQQEEWQRQQRERLDELRRAASDR